MQQDVSRPPMTGETEMQTRRETERMGRERQPVEYLFDPFGTMFGGVGQFFGFISQQTRERPMIVGPLFVGFIGAILGARFAQIQAMRRRKNFFERTNDTLRYIGAIATGWIRPAGPIGIVRDRGGEVIEGVTTTMMGAIPTGIPRLEMRRGSESPARQFGYALSLIPISLALIRNPLVRDLGFRYLSRRISGR